MSQFATCSRCKAPAPPTARFCERCGNPLLPAAAMTFGDYEVTEVIGEGGMGRVYKATQHRLNRSVCIKTLLPQYAGEPHVVRRFEKEATTMAALSHPNIVSVFDVGRSSDGAAFIVMELIDGRPLRLILRDESPVPIERAVRLIDQVLAALAEAHLHGIVHRDLKPSNVLVVALRDGSELCKVLDFGIARTLDHAESDDPLTQTGVLLGTPGYMAPEQLAGEPYDHRIDLYAAGALLYELITGRRVFRGANDAELRRKALFEVPALASTVTSQQIPKLVDDICAQALARSAGDRYQSANAFREALAQVVRTVTGVPPVHPAFEYTPLAVAVGSSASGIFTTNSRALVSAVLAATSDWERTHMLENYERSMLEYLGNGDVESVRSAIKVLQIEQKDPKHLEALKALFEVTRRLLIGTLPTLFEWLRNEPTRRGGQWLLRVLGPSALPLYLKELGELDAETQQQLLIVIKLIDPDLSAVLSLLRAADPKSLKALLSVARDWPDDQSRQVFAQLLQAPEGVSRQIALETLDERTAFRLALVIRQRVHDPVVGVRIEALRWVFRLEDEDAVPDLSRLLERTGLSMVERRSVWRVLSHLKTEEAVSLLIRAIDETREPSEVGELSMLLVRTRSQRAIGHVERMLTAAGTNAKLKRVIEEALREVRGQVLVSGVSTFTPTPAPAPSDFVGSSPSRVGEQGAPKPTPTP